jgi:hypothetical protein
MTKNLRHTALRAAEIPVDALVQKYYCPLELGAVAGSDESLRLAGRTR